jgi:hypothetical protein
VWWIRPLILALGKEDCKFKAILAYIETPFLSKKKKIPKTKTKLKQKKKRKILS